MHTSVGKGHKARLKSCKRLAQFRTLSRCVPRSLALVRVQFSNGDRVRRARPAESALEDGLADQICSGMVNWRRSLLRVTRGLVYRSLFKRDLVYRSLWTGCTRARLTECCSAYLAKDARARSLLHARWQKRWEALRRRK